MIKVDEMLKNLQILKPVDISSQQTKERILMEELRIQFVEVCNKFGNGSLEAWEWINQNFIPKQDYNAGVDEKLRNLKILKNVDITTHPSKAERKVHFATGVFRTQLDWIVIPKQDYRDFIDYWTESGENQKKMRFEFQKVFDIKRRLNTWMRNKSKPSGTVSQETKDIYNKLGF